ncbi:TonB-dependent receptor [Asticcacaulis machinosus]|uniref:TonB-dependent receptor n=1 Tax=Asticcacaulis machinosus TaxID=2984211 RepID=A0ABT5HHH6_9CAUL|nr:TonB-dependent receptor [Asticcacaulis machinosus]MDC7675610.1 TonB-dependent receptor [Asticcacaulis machinosus]
MKTALFTNAAVAAILSAAIAPSAFADTVAAPAADEAITEVIVYGQGQSRQVQAVKASELALEAPGTSPLKAIDKLPGVTFQSSDPFGSYEWSTRIGVRGFNQNQMGFTLDGVPLGDMSYGNHNGLHISRAITNEDVARVELTQGAGSLSTASTSNLGGTLQFFSRDPSSVMGGEVAGTVGSEAMHRLYGRFETGEIAQLNNLRAYVSVADQKTDKWKGGSEQKQRQFSAKAVMPIGEGEITGFFNRSERREQDYQDMSFDMISRLSRDWDNFQPNWALANQVAAAYQNPANYAPVNPILDGNGCWTGNGANPYQGGVKCIDDAYYAGAGIRDDNLGALSISYPLTDTISVKASLYKHTNEGQGLWYTPYVRTPATIANAANITIRTTEYDVDRTGAFGSVMFDLGAHQVSAGLWIETNDFNQARRFYGETLSAPSRDPLDFQSNPLLTQWQYAFTTQTYTGYVQDVWTVTEAFKVNFGFKAVKVSNKVRRIAGNVMNGKIESDDSFLPQVGVVYKLDNNIELFGGYTENMAAYVSAATSGPFSSQSQANVDFVKSSLDPETSKTLEGGLRLNAGSAFQGVVALYHVEFDNRLLGVAQGASIVGNATVLSNVGGVETNGVEVAGTWRITPEWKLYSSYSYNDSQYQDNVVNAAGAILANTKGKTVVDTPKHMFNAEVAYDNGKLFGTLGMKFTGERYYTYENRGGKVDSAKVADFTAGYRFANDLDVQVNVTNLLDEDYISTIGSGGFKNADLTGEAMTILPAAPRMAFITVKKRF